MFETAEASALLTSYISPTAKRSDESGARLTRDYSLAPELGNSVPLREAGKSEDTAVALREQPALSFKTLESWVCKVEAVDRASGTFTAVAASDKQGGIQELAEFQIDELSSDDVALLHPGAVFYWSIGYQINEFGGRLTASAIRFRRIRHWTRKEVEAAKARASAYSKWFVGGNGDNDRSAEGQRA